MEAEWGLDDLTDLTDPEVERRLIEGPYHLSSTEEAEVTTPPRTPLIIGVLLSDLGEVGTRHDLCAKILGLRQRLLPLFCTRVGRDTATGMASAAFYHWPFTLSLV